MFKSGMGLGVVGLFFWVLLSQAVALPGSVVLRMLDQDSDGKPIYTTIFSTVSSSGDSYNTYQFSGTWANPGVENTSSLTDFVYLPTDAKQGVLAIAGPASTFRSNGGVISFARIDFDKPVRYSTNRQRIGDQEGEGFASISLANIGPISDPTALAISLPIRGTAYPELAALSYYNQTVIYNVGSRLKANGNVTVSARIPGQYSGLAFLDNERLVLVGSKGITLASASTGTVLSSITASDFSKVASLNGVTVFWGSSQVGVLEGNQIRTSNIPMQTVDSCSVVLKTIPICITSGNGKTLWYYENGKWLSFWSNPQLANDDPWKIAIGEGLILPLVSSKPSAYFVRLYTADGIEFNSRMYPTDQKSNFSINLISMVALAAKLKNEVAPATDMVAFTPKRCDERRYGNAVQVNDWVLVTGCNEVTLVDFKQGSKVFQGPQEQVVPDVIFQATGKQVNVRSVSSNENLVGLGGNLDGKPLLLIQQDTFGRINGFPWCAAAFLFEASRFSMVAATKPLSENYCGGSTGQKSILGYVSGTEVALTSDNSGFSIFDRSGNRLIFFDYGRNLTVGGKPWYKGSTTITEILPRLDGYRAYGYYNGYIGSFDIDPLDGSFSKFERTAPLYGGMPSGNGYDSYLPNTSPIGYGWRMYEVPTVEGLAMPSYVSPEGHLIYLNSKGIVRIKLSNESIKRWAGQ